MQADQQSGIEIATSPLPKRSVRAERISQLLRGAAKNVRAPGAAWFGASTVQVRWQHGFRLAVLLSFFAIVVVPILTVSIYLGLIASDQYASEFRFAVRGGSHSAFDVNSAAGLLAGLPRTQRTQDSLILYEYIRGRGIVEVLDRTINLRKIYSSPTADYFSRFNPKESNEELVLYWRWRVYVGYDVMSSTITVIVRAFTPEEALLVSKAIIELSEKLVNDLSDRARRDALQLAKSSLGRAEENLEQKAKAMRDLRNTEGVLDATEVAEVMMKMLGELRLELLRMEQEIAIQRRSVTSDSPQLQVQIARIASVKEQIRRLEAQMTNSNVGDTALSNAMGRFERLKLEREIADKRYEAAAAAFERARLELETQQIYVATFLQPVLAQEPLYPRRWWLWSIVVAASLAIWGAGISIATLIRNYVAI
jgi:capsular polysaccharide transport system permease protein